MLNMHQRLQSDMKDAMRARDQLRVDTLRMAMNAIKSSFDNQKKQAYAFARSLGITDPTSFDVVSTRAPHHLVHQYKHLYS